MKVDHAAKAANDDTTETPTLGEHLDKAQAASDAAAAKAAKKAKGKKTKDVPEVKLDTEDALRHELAVLRERLHAFEKRREAEQALLSNRDAILHELEGCKNRTSAKKQELSETEEKIAALLRQPMPTKWEDTPIGRAIGDTKEPTPPPAMPWKEVLPQISEDRMRMLGDDTKGELPTVDAICGALMDPKAMAGEKRTVAQTVECYGTPNIVTHLWKDPQTGACRAHVVPLCTKDEFQQLHEKKYGRAVKDFDQNDESKVQRQHGGEFCGLMVKANRKTYVVGPQDTALHLAYLPPDKATDAKGPEEVELPKDDAKPAKKSKRSKADE